MIYEHQLSPYVFTIGSFGLKWYITMYAIGFLLAAIGISRDARFKLYGLTNDDIAEILTWAFLGILIGGRLGYVLFYKPIYFGQHPLEILAVQKGGMSFHGGLMGVALAVYILLKRRGLSHWKVEDIFCLYAPLALMCGRIGNFILGELWGKPTNSN